MRGELYNEFDIVVYIALREWKEDGLESIIKKIYFEEKHKDEAIEIHQSKTLFLFDGYDELSETSLLHGAIKKYNLKNYIITSRPYGYRKSDFDVHEVFETIGFTDENVASYIDKFFEEQNHKTNLQNFLKQNINIRHLAYIPLMLEIICSIWREKAKSNQSFLSPMTMTELYSEVIDNLLSTYARKKGYEEVYKRRYRKQIVTYFGSIAFEALKNQTIIIDGEVLENSLANIETEDEDNFLEKNILYTGLLKSNNKYQDPWKNSYQFPHLTFQEYFSARYIVDWNLLETELINHVLEPHWREVFILTISMLDDVDTFMKSIKLQIDKLLEKNIEFQKLLKWAYSVSSVVDGFSDKTIARSFFHTLVYAHTYAEIHQTWDTSELIHEHPTSRVYGINKVNRSWGKLYDMSWGLSSMLSPELQKVVINSNLAQKLSDRWVNDVKNTMFQSYRVQYANNKFKTRNLYPILEQLNSYYYGNELMIDCLNSQCNISSKVRCEIYDSLLLPIK
ncbi:MAG: Unknown protein [uncultured Sulfurovum sp.]|uniref:NACHT domain-containing protein n=1 Tax=uncultured Sulfurovum sp. TaxID=269237 RepID=A0A6S6T363_9BACT|nr:MAG: Unknown protein [uncultured Sulfurovum sp.]